TPLALHVDDQRGQQVRRDETQILGHGDDGQDQHVRGGLDTQLRRVLVRDLDVIARMDGKWIDDDENELGHRNALQQADGQTQLVLDERKDLELRETDQARLEGNDLAAV